MSIDNGELCRLGLTSLALVLLAGLIGAGRANATHLDPSDAFYWLSLIHI